MMILRLLSGLYVPIGADPEAMRSAYMRSLDALLELPTSEPEKEKGMTDEEIQKAIALGIKVGLAADAEARTKIMDDQFAALKVAAEQTAKTPPEEPTPKEPPAETEAEKETKQTELVEARAALLVKSRSLLPKEFDTKGKTDREIMVAAIGTAIKDAGERSDGYLEATMDGILDRREAGAQYRSHAASTTGSGGGMDMSREDLQKAVNTRSIDPEKAVEIAKTLQQQELLARSHT